MRPLRFAVVLALLTGSGRLSADPKEPAGEALQMAADHVELDIEAKSATLTGHVRLEKGAVIVRCPRVDVRYDEIPHVTWAKGTGGISAEVRGVKAEAPEVELDVAGQRLELRGGVRLARGEGWISAEQATIQLATGKVTLTGVKGSLPVDDPAAGGKSGTPRPAP